MFGTFKYLPLRVAAFLAASGTCGLATATGWQATILPITTTNGPVFDSGGADYGTSSQWCGGVFDATGFGGHACIVENGNLLDIHPSGFASSEAFAFTNATIVGYAGDLVAGTSTPIAWTNAASPTATQLPFGTSGGVPNTWGVAWNISGSTIVGLVSADPNANNDDSPTFACTWAKQGNSYAFSELPQGGFSSTGANCDASNGSTVTVCGWGSKSGDAATHLLVWKGLSSQPSELANITDGSVIYGTDGASAAGYMPVGTYLHPAVWDLATGASTDLLTATGANGLSGQAYAVASNYVVGEEKIAYNHASIWTKSNGIYACTELHGCVETAAQGHNVGNTWATSIETEGTTIVVLGWAIIDGFMRPVRWTNSSTHRPPSALKIVPLQTRGGIAKARPVK